MIDHASTSMTKSCRSNLNPHLSFLVYPKILEWESYRRLTGNK